MQFNREVHQALANPLAITYRKTFNSASAKELHDNACDFGFCLMRLLASVVLAQLRAQGGSLPNDGDSAARALRRPSLGHWFGWMTRSLPSTADNRSLDSPVGMLDAFLSQKLSLDNSQVPEAVSRLLSYLDNKQVVRRTATVREFFEVLIQYRNRTIGHGAVLTEELNRMHGDVVLSAASELAVAAPVCDGWDLKYVDETSLEAELVACRYINLMGPDWLREQPVRYPRGFPVPMASHVVLVPRDERRVPLDLHPLLVFQQTNVCFYNSLGRREVHYLDFASGDQLRISDTFDDYQQFEQLLVQTGRSAIDEAPAAPVQRRFRFDRKIGQGGMGEIWLAFDQTLNREVAIKRIRHELIGQSDVHRRFLQEARDAAKLSHANIVPILSIDSDEDGSFLVLEYLAGGSLRERIGKGKLPLIESLSILRQMLQALAAAHGQGVVHRDIKPENILLTSAGVPKLADFGLAWALDLVDTPEPSDRAPASIDEGTRLYMAPELANRSEPPGPRTDLYSLGLVFYEMLTAQSPETLREDKIPSAASPLFRKLSHRNPNLRYDSAQLALDDCIELERALELAGRDEEQTRARIADTIRRGYDFVAEGKTIDAQACFERVLAESGDHAGGEVGLLLLNLIAGDMPEAARRYRALGQRAGDDPVFQQIDRFVRSIDSPTELYISPRAMPFCYLCADLHNGRFTKDLVQFDKKAINLGDVGELLMELVHRAEGNAAIEYRPTSGNRHCLRFQLPETSVLATYDFRLAKRPLLLPPKLNGINLKLTIEGEPFEIYRLVRYLGRNLAQRFRRAPDDWIDASEATRQEIDGDVELDHWQRLLCQFETFADAGRRP